MRRRDRAGRAAWQAPRGALSIGGPQSFLMPFSDKPREPSAPRKARPRISLKMQAIGFLSRREHSRQELRAKLLDALRKRGREDAALATASQKAAQALAEALSEQPSNGIDDAFAPPAASAASASAATAEHAASRSPGADAPSDDELEGADPEAAVDRLLDWLAANNYLSEARFVESRVNARSRKQGTLRIKLELSRHGLTLEPEQAASLRETEFARAQALWQRKFGALAPDARLRAKQARFLAARGFAADVVRRVVGGQEED
jgi:regulatory protein